ncbi:hypothetical protein [Cellulosimicrobium sp. JZ28]|uniref:hypothetical protein n=1 Tax=Cellulosimicrobium sp. JZ28 TaxID=1906273 RepID=UPI00188A2633|nr:hypothetical protein [Cellulosimicrobium sp. JZ28]
MGKVWQDGPGGGTPIDAAALNELVQKVDLDGLVADELGKPASQTSQSLADLLAVLAPGLGVSTPDAATLVRRNDHGRTQFADPVAAADAATKGYADSGRVRGADGRLYRVVAGVIRNDGSGWAVLNDSGHQPTNIASVSANADAITIGYGFTGTKVAALLVVPDETFAQEGYLAGASVGLSSAAIRVSRMGKSVSDYVSYNATAGAWTSLGGVFTGLAWSAGTLTLTHETVTGAAGSVAGRGGVYQPQLGSMSGTTTDVEFFDWAGTKVTTPNANCRAFVTRNANRVIAPVNPTLLANAAGNFWIFGLIEVAP